MFLFQPPHLGPKLTLERNQSGELAGAGPPSSWITTCLPENPESTSHPCVPVCRSMMEYDSENLNSEEIYSSLRGVTEAIQNYSFRSQDDLMDLRRDGKRDGMVSVRDGTFSSSPDAWRSHPSPPRQSGVGASSDTDGVGCGRTALDNKTSLLNTPSPRSFGGPRFRDYNPYNYTDALDKAAVKEAFHEGDGEHLRDGEAPSQELVLQNKSISIALPPPHRHPTRVR